MDGKMKEVFAINFREKNEWEAVSVRKQHGRFKVTSVKKFAESSPEAETFIRRNAGRIIALFPFENAYCHEIRTSKKLSQKSLYPILKASTEAALPVHLNGQFHFDLSMNHSEKDEQRLQLITELPKDALYSYYELEMIELQPAALFEGFYRLFNFPQDQKYFLYYQGPQYALLAAGKRGRIQKMRIVKKTSTRQFQENISNFLKGENVEMGYSWCGEAEVQILSDIPFSESPQKGWKHLKSIAMAAEIQPYKDKLEWICHAVAFLEGFLNPCSRVCPPRFSLFQGRLAKTAIQLLGIVTALMGIVFLYACIRLNSLGRDEYLLNRSISEIFYSYFPSQTPQINPVGQVSELLRVNSEKDELSANIPDSAVLLESLSAFFKDTSGGQTVTRMTQEENRVSIEGLYEDRNKTRQWAKSLNGLEFRGLRIHGIKMEWPADNRYRLNFEYQRSGS